MIYLNPALNGEIGSSTRQTLEAVEYRIDLFWLAEESNTPWTGVDPPPLTFAAPGVWSVDVRDAAGVVLIQGQIMRHGADVLAGMTSIPGMPPGRLQAWDTSGNGRDPGRDDLDPGSEVRLVYRTAAEVGR